MATSHECHCVVASCFKCGTMFRVAHHQDASLSATESFPDANWNTRFFYMVEIYFAHSLLINYITYSGHESVANTPNRWHIPREQSHGERNWCLFVTRRGMRANQTESHNRFSAKVSSIVDYYCFAVFVAVSILSVVIETAGRIQCASTLCHTMRESSVRKAAFHPSTVMQPVWVSVETVLERRQTAV